MNTEIKQLNISNANEFQIKLDNFSGPFDLLLSLIDEKQIDIFDIFIGEITNSYLQHVKNLPNVNLDTAGEFLFMASALIELKSRTLLPQTSDEALSLSDDIENERVAILNRLVEYKLFKQAAIDLMGKEEDRSLIFTRAPINEQMITSADEKAPIILKNVSLGDLVKAMQKVYDRAQETPKTGVVFEDRFTVREKMEFITGLLKGKDKRCLFSELFTGTYYKLEVITTFLALLELARMKILVLTQNEVYGEIELVGLEYEEHMMEEHLAQMDS